jgi:hypothetical protein
MAVTDDDDLVVQELAARDVQQRAGSDVGQVDGRLGSA